MVTRLRQILSDREARQNQTSSNVPVQNVPLDNNANTPQELTIVEVTTEPKTEFEPVEKQRHFGILHYAMTTRFKKVILIGLCNAILIAALFLLIVFLVIGENNSANTSLTTITTELKTTVQFLILDRIPICADGFTMIDNKCWMLLPSRDNHANSDNLCFKQKGSTLVTIKNFYENDALASFVKNTNVANIWLGLECDSHAKCEWDYGQGALDFSKLNGKSGDCAYYSVATKQWISDSCSENDISIVCELPTTIYDNCKNNYDNNCYLEINRGMLWDDAIAKCEMNSGTLLVINSALENRFVQSIYSIPGYMLLGCMAASQSLVRCVTRPPNRVQYNNLNSFVDGLYCVFMNYPTGNWYTDSCTKFAWFICKRPNGVNP